MSQGTARHDVSSLCVLVVEDEVLIAMDIELMLTDHGHTVLGPVGSVERALHMLKTARPEVAVLDVNLRGQLVFPVAERLRDLRVPFVIASAYESMNFDGGESVMDVENVGKPIDKGRLLGALERAVQAGPDRTGGAETGASAS